MDVKTGLMDTVWERVGGMNGESSNNIYTLLCVKWIAGEKLLHNTGAVMHRLHNSLVLCDDLEGWDGGKGGTLKREVIYV